MIIRESKIVYRKIGENDVSENKEFTAPADFVGYLKSAFKEWQGQEVFLILMLDGQNRPIARHLCTVGTLNQSLVHPRETFRAAVMSGAAAIILAHNHPSGAPKFSPEDQNTTKKLIECSKILEIPILDHLLINENSFHSMRSLHPSFFQ